MNLPDLMFRIPDFTLRGPNKGKPSFHIAGRRTRTNYHWTDGPTAKPEHPNLGRDIHCFEKFGANESRPDRKPRQNKGVEKLAQIRVAAR
jgi:hypothetical protein